MAPDQNHNRVCDPYREKLLRLRDGLLETEEREEALRHLESCRQCHDDYREMIQFEEGLKRVLAGGEPASAELKSELDIRFRKACEIWQAERGPEPSPVEVAGLPGPVPERPGMAPREHPRPGKGIPRRLVLATAAAVILFMVLFALTRSPGEGAIHELAMSRVDGTRGPETNVWEPGERFVLMVTTSKPLYLHIVHLDASQEIDFCFPLLRAADNKRRYLGYRSNLIPGERPLSLPSPDFPDVLAIDAPRGAKEFFFCFGCSRETPGEELERFQEDLKKEAEKGKQSGLSPEAISERVGALIRSRYPIVRVISYTVAGTPTEPPAPPTIEKNRQGVLTKEDPLLPEKGHYQSFTFIGKDAGKITIRLESKDFDAELVVRDWNGEVVAADEDGGPGDGAELVFETEAGEKYTILAASTNEDALGAFQLEALPGHAETRTTGKETERDLAWYQETLKADVPVARRLELLRRISQCHLSLGDLMKAREASEVGLRLARQVGDRREEGRALANLGIPSLALDTPDKAIEYFQEALAILKEAADRRGVGIVLGNLGAAYDRLGEPEKAIECYESSLGIRREMKDRRGEGRVLGNLGSAYLDLGQPKTAIEYYRKALAIHREVKNRRSEGIVLTGLGNLYWTLDQRKTALEYHQEALAIYQEAKDLHGKGVSLGNLGSVWLELGELGSAMDCCKEALAIMRETKDRRGELTMLGNLGNVYRELGQANRAIDCCEKALAIQRETKDPSGGGYLLRVLADAYGDLGQPKKAAEYYEAALAADKEAKDGREIGAVLGRLGNTYLELGQPERAIEYQQKALVIAREMGYRISEGAALLNMGSAYLDLAQPKTAADYFEKAFAILEDVDDATGVRLALTALGNTYWKLNLPKKAIEYYQKVLALHGEMANSQVKRDVLVKLGNAYTFIGQPQAAIDHYNRALAMLQGVADRSTEAGVLTSLGTVYGDLGQQKKAMEYHSRALALAHETEDQQVTAGALLNLGVSCMYLWQLHRAIDHFNKSLGIAQKAGDRRVEAGALQGLGNVYQRLGQPETAIEYHKKALSILRQIHDRRGEGGALGNLGIAYLDLGQLEKAIENHEKALAIHRATDHRRGQSCVLGNIGNYYSLLGQPRKAIQYHETALAISRELEERWSEKVDLGHLGIAYSQLGEFGKAIEYHEKAFDISREMEDRRGEGAALGNLGTAFLRLGEPEKAKEHLEKALAISRELGDRPGEGVDLRELGDVYSHLGDSDKAIEYYERSLPICRETKNRIGEAWTLGAIGDVHVREGRLDLGLDAYRDAHSITMTVLEEVERGLETSATRSFLATGPMRRVEGHFELLMKLTEGNKGEKKKQAYLLEAFSLVEGLRSRAMVNSMRAGQLRDILRPEGKLLWDRMMALRKGMSEAMSGATANPPPGEPKEVLGDHGEDIDSLERRLKRTEPEYAELCAAPRKPDPGLLADIVGPKEFLVDYNLVGEQVAVFIWGPDEVLRVQVLEVGSKELTARVEGALEAIRRRTQIPELKKNLRALRQTLFLGFEERLEEAQGLLVIPDGILHLLPFEALVLGDGSYLVERYRVRYAPSVQVLAELGTAQDMEAEFDLLLYGDPDLGGEEEASAELASSVRVRGGMRFRRLEHAASELNEVGGLFGKKLLRKGREATEQGFKREAGAGAILHVATHGVFSRGPEGSERDAGGALYYSGLAFQGYNEGGDGQEDGFLTAAEVLGLDLRRVDLAVLSACETASGEVRGYEGKFGLERAFFVAGVKTFLGSLWKVDDRATSEFMGRFHQLIPKGVGRAEALRRTKLDFLGKTWSSRGRALAKQGDEEPAAERGPTLVPRKAERRHPYYWAPFVLSGEGGPLPRRPPATRPERPQ